MDELLKSISSYIENKPQNKWKAGIDWVQYAGPYFDSAEITEAVKTLLEGWLVLGEQGLRFENQFPKYMGKDYGLLTNSGSSSNLLMLSALRSERLYNLPEKTKVITPIAGFPTTINPIYQVGFEPVFVDIDLDTLNLNLDQVEQHAKNGCKVLVFAHVLGNPPNMKRLMEIVKQYDMILLEDCCDALGSSYNNQYLGSFGELASCSFYPAHHITMGEGGFVSCRTKEQETVVRSFREWGRGCFCVGKSASLLPNGCCKKRFSNWIPALPDQTYDHKYVYDEIGYNLKPIELQASIGLMQLKKLDEIIRKRKHNFHRLSNIFREYEDLFILPKAQENSDPSWFAFALTIKEKIERAELVNFLESRKIQTRPYFAGNVMLQPAYKSKMNSYYAINNFPNATRVMKDTFFLGVSPVITDEQIDYIGQTFNEFTRLKGIR